MRHSPRLRPGFTFLALLLLLGGLPGRCLALDLISDVSKERAKELGITVRSQPSANNDLWVQVEFKPTDPKREFKRADLDITRNGKRLVTASLMPQRPAPDRMRFDFYIDPAALPDASVMIVVWSDPLTGQGYRIKMKEFVAPPASR